MVSVSIALLALVAALVPAGLAAPPPDRTGVIHVGTGHMRLAPGIDHVITFAPYGAVGFDLFGEHLHYSYLRMFDGGGDFYRVDVLADVGHVEAPWSIRWIMQGPAQVVFSGPGRSDCVDLTCSALTR